MALKRSFIFIGFFIFSLQSVFCQQKKTIHIYEDGKKTETTTIGDSSKIFVVLETYLNTLKSNGFAAAALDSLQQSGDTAFAYIYKGNLYFISNLSLNISPEIIKNLKLDKQLKNTSKFVYTDLEAISKEINYYLENRGYPFAKVFYENWQIQEDSFSMQLSVDNGNFISIDSFSNKTKSKISNSLLKAYLGISIGDSYNESLLKNMDAKLRKLPYLNVSKPSEIVFSENGAAINVSVERKKTNQVDFIFGILPKNTITGKTTITGEARVNLWNAFGKGEKIFIEWRKLERSSQNLQLLFEYPFLLGTAIGINTDFGLKKRDTSHLDINWSMGIPYQFSGNGRIKLFFKNFQTLVLRPDTAFAARTKTLPVLQDVSSFVYGAEIYFDALDNLFQPQSGWEILGSVGIGTRKIKRNVAYSEIESTAFPDYNFDNLYDSIDTKSLKSEIAWQLNYYWRFANHHVAKFGTQGKGIFNKNLLENEYFRIGGAKILRGFDDESIRVSLYSMLNFEYRYLLSSNSYVFLFVDAAFTQQKRAQFTQNDFPFGFGAGINFSTKVGVFGLTYGIGREQKNPIDFRGAKIHFGYLNYF